MKVIEASSPDDALAQGMRHLLERGVREPSRVGEVLVAPAPVATVYRYPRARVSFSPVRDANPFFHVMEALWMLAGRNDVAFLAAYNQRMAEFIHQLIVERIQGLWSIQSYQSDLAVGLDEDILVIHVWLHFDLLKGCHDFTWPDLGEPFLELDLGCDVAMVSRIWDCPTL